MPPALSLSASLPFPLYLSIKRPTFFPHAPAVSPPPPIVPSVLVQGAPSFVISLTLVSSFDVLRTMRSTFSFPLPYENSCQLGRASRNSSASLTQPLKHVPLPAWSTSDPFQLPFPPPFSPPQFFDRIFFSHLEIHNQFLDKRRCQ